MSEQFPNQDEGLEPISYQLETEDGIKTLRSPFKVAVFGKLGPDEYLVCLGIGEVVGSSKNIPPNYMDLGLPLVRIQDPTAPRGFVELIGGVECDIDIFEDDIEEVTDFASENPELIMSASKYKRRLQANPN